MIKPGTHFIRRFGTEAWRGTVVSMTDSGLALVELWSWKDDSVLFQKILSTDDLRECDFFTTKKAFQSAVNGITKPKRMS